MSTTPWTFLSNHTHVLVCIAQDPDASMRAISASVGITERAVQRIIGELVDGGYLIRQRQGRRNTYRIELDLPLRHPVEQATPLRDLLGLFSSAGP